MTAPNARDGEHARHPLTKRRRRSRKRRACKKRPARSIGAHRQDCLLGSVAGLWLGIACVGVIA
jgi:hypothetical protein